MAKKPTYVKETLDRLEEGIQDFFQSDRYRTFLQVMSRFHNYSGTNCMLIAKQNPAATYVAGYQDWQKKFGRHVKRGEHGLEIMAPMQFTRDVETKEKDDQGNAIIKKETYFTFRPVYVFDVSQTEGKELPQLAAKLDFEVEDYDRIMDALHDISSFRVIFDDIPNGANGYCNPALHIIGIQEGMSNAQTIKTFIHEITHSELHSGAFTLASRQQKEVEAESTAFIVCDYLGLDTSDYSFGYIAAWAGENSKEVLKSCITNIKTASTKLIQELDSRLHISQQEKTPAEKKEMEQKVVEEANQVLQEKGLDAVVKDAVVYSPLPSEEKVSVSMDLREIREHAEMTAEITALEHPEKPFTFCTLSETGCSYESAVQEMDNTHMVYGTSNGVLVYALTQSFTAGEVTPEMAHEIGLKTIDEYWEKQEVLLSTVQSEGVIQNRYVINPTSYMDGSKKQISGWDVHDMRRLAEKLGKELSAGRPEELHMYVTNQDRSFEADFVLQGNKQQVMDILTRQESYQYLNEYLISQGIPCQVEAVKPDTNFALSYDYSTMTVYDMHPEESSQQPAAEQTETEQVAPDQAAPEHAAAMVEIAGTAREEDVFQALNDAAPVIDGMTIRMNTVKQEGNAAESYIERLDVYEKLGYDARWPMVTIAYTNIPGVKNQSLNIHEAVKLLQKLSRKGELNANSFMKIKLSYTYNDWNYEVVQDIERRTGRINFIDYLNLPSKVIHHLKGHDSILTMVELAKNFAPDTQYGSDYADDMQLWAEYCRMELNHNSDAPVLPRPPEIDADYIVSNDDWRLER